MMKVLNWTGIIFFLFNYFPFLNSRQWSSRVVSTRFGSVRGFLFIPPRGGGEHVEIFLGLPYASPPVGSLRFMPPVSGSPWLSTRLTTQPFPVCPQVLPSIANETEALKSMPRGQLNILRRLLPFLKNQSEDCLYLNIYVPISGKTSSLLPVLTFVHGNDYGYGGGHPYDPSMLVSQGQVIVVTFNYRLGILGFLNANSEGYFKSPANFALLDQIAALHWVQENIGAFGGDRGNVTLMGHGKGGVFANFLMISSAVPTALLFHRVILASGSALSPNAAGSFGISNGKELAKRFASSVKCPVEPPSEMLGCLRQIPLEDFLESNLWSFFGPSEDGVTIEDGIKEPLLRDRLAHYPLLFGVTKVEMLQSISEHDAVFGIETERRREILKGFIEKHFSVHRNEILAAAIHEYTEWERPVQHPISVRDETLDALADAQVVAPLVKTGDFHSHSNSKSFFYVFEYQSKTSDFQQRLGCIHGEDLLYLFGVPLFFYGNEALSSTIPVHPSESHVEKFGDSEEDVSSSTSITSDYHQSRLGFFVGNFTRNEVQLSQTVIQFWTNFIKTGNPNEAISSDGSNEGSGSRSSSGDNKGSGSKSKILEWPHYDPIYKKYLTIDMKPRMRTHYRAHKLSFWLHLVPDLMKNGYGILSGTHHNVEVDPVTNLTATPPPPTIQLVGPPLWEHNTKGKHFFSGNMTYEGGSTGSVRHGGTGGGDGEGDGYQIYSTALSVTIAIGCSLLILNILIFAAFYYQRDKRRNEGPYADHSNPIGYDDGSTNQFQHQPSMQQPPPPQQFHRKENGQIGSLQMPNICGDLPTLLPSSPESNSTTVPEHLLHQQQQPPPVQYQLQQFQDPGYPTSSSIPTPTIHSQHVQRGTLKRFPKFPQHQQPSAYEMTIPDAILAAAMMNIHHQQPPIHYSPHNHPHSYGIGSTLPDGGSPSDLRGPIRASRRSSLTFKDQLISGHGLEQSPDGSSGGGCRTLPRPPKRTTPSVKFSCGEGMSGEGEGGDGSLCGVYGGDNGSGTKLGTHQTLKPSLKKSSNYATSSSGGFSPSPSTMTTDELKV